MITAIRAVGIAACLLLVPVLHGCAADQSHESTGQYVDDSAITAKVKARLLNDSITNGVAIDVETYKGQVELSGYVKSDKIRDRADELAENVPGVVTVHNDIRVRD